MDERHFILKNGYRLGYNLYGPAQGTPVFYFHGSPSARIEFEIFADEKLLNLLNIRVVSVDRPGMGISDFQPYRKILNWPEDVSALADSLHIDRFAVLAYSLGGPYGMACAFSIPERVKKVGVVSGAAIFTHPELMVNINPGTRKYIFLPKNNPGTARFFLRAMKTMASLAPNMVISNARSMLPEPDRAAVSTTETQEAFITMVREAFHQGIHGPFLESYLIIQDWGFSLQEIQAPVFLWHGNDDANIPVEMAQYCASEIPNSIPMFFPGEGHISLFKNHASSILRFLSEK